MNRRLYLLLAISITIALLTSGVDARLASNRLASNRLASNRLASNRLASNALTSASLDATQATAELLRDEEGRNLYGYMVSCALPAETTLQIPVAGVVDEGGDGSNYLCTNGTCTFFGNLGLAEYWVNRKLDPKGQRWITACLLARVNHTETAEAISMRGVAPSLMVGDEEAAEFALQEGAFFGNIFTDSEELDWNACRGEDKALTPTAGGLGIRECTEPDPAHPGFTMCGFKYAGDCADYGHAIPTPHACRTFDTEDGTYGDCHAPDATGEPSTTGSRPYREIITTYVSTL